MVSVTLDNITKRFGDVVAVDRVTLHVEKGELFFLLGPSGCGKTTLLRMIAGFYSADGGAIRFGDRDMTDVPPHKRNAGMVFQNYALWPHMTVTENVAYGLDVRRVDAAEREERVRKVLETVRMDQYADRRPNQLSGGQQQRIALARALVIEPDVVLLDEPLSNLDAKLRLEMRDEIKHIHQALDVTMIYVTHDQKEALSMADRLAVMDRGHVEQVGPPREVYTEPVNTFVAGFVGETNFLRGRIVERPSPSALGKIGTAVADLTDETKVLAAPLRDRDDRVFIETPYGLIATSREVAGHVGEEVVCSVRPEAMRVGAGEGALSGGFIEGVVESVVYLGDTEQYVVVLSDDRRVRCVESNPSQPRAKVGDGVKLTFDAADVIMLPAD